MIKNLIGTTVLAFLFLLSSALTSMVVANGTLSSSVPASKAKKQSKVTCPQTEDTICPIACPCPESWLGGALDPCYTPPATEPCEVTCCFNSGFYLGAHIGYLYPRHKYNVILSGIFNKTKHQDTVLGGVVLGGRYFIYNCLFLGTEISANMDGSSTKFFINGNFADSYIHKLRRQFSIIPAATLGATFAEVVAIYLKLGADISRYRAIIFTTNSLFSSTFKTHKTTTEFLPAVGLEYCFSPTISTRLEISHNFNSKKVSLAATTITGTNDRLKVKAQNTALTFGFLYKF